VRIAVVVLGAEGRPSRAAPARGVFAPFCPWIANGAADDLARRFLARVSATSYGSLEDHLHLAAQRAERALAHLRDVGCRRKRTVAGGSDRAALSIRARGRRLAAAGPRRRCRAVSPRRTVRVDALRPRAPATCCARNTPLPDRQSAFVRFSTSTRLPFVAHAASPEPVDRALRSFRAACRPTASPAGIRMRFGQRRHERAGRSTAPRLEAEPAGACGTGTRARRGEQRRRRALDRHERGEPAARSTASSRGAPTCTGAAGWSKIWRAGPYSMIRPAYMTITEFRGSLRRRRDRA